MQRQFYTSLTANDLRTPAGPPRAFLPEHTLWAFTLVTHDTSPLTPRHLRADPATQCAATRGYIMF